MALVGETNEQDTSAVEMRWVWSLLDMAAKTKGD